VPNIRTYFTLLITLIALILLFLLILLPCSRIFRTNPTCRDGFLKKNGFWSKLGSAICVHKHIVMGHNVIGATRECTQSETVRPAKTTGSN
jgi:hypothetical protein